MPEISRFFGIVIRMYFDDHNPPHFLELRFADGTMKKVDFRKKVVGRGGVFLPLEDVGFFKRVRVDPEAGTIVWPNGDT